MGEAVELDHGDLHGKGARLKRRKRKRLKRSIRRRLN